jgi:hypothetical protein
MWQLDYGRDNRLRLWFLGIDRSENLDVRVSPTEEQFLQLMKACFEHWKTILAPNGYCVLILGDTQCKKLGLPLPYAVTHVATEEVGGYRVSWQHCESIPLDRRVRRGYRGSRVETVLALQRT